MVQHFRDAENLAYKFSEKKKLKWFMCVYPGEGKRGEKSCQL